MAGTKKRAPTVKTVLRWIKAGYGQGVGSDFKSFMYVRDVPSEGTSSMVQSRVTGRTHHYLSWVEFSVHLLAEYSRSIADIREQYALLPWDETQETAAKLGIKHPVIPYTSTPSVITTDLLLSFKEPEFVKLCASHGTPLLLSCSNCYCDRKAARMWRTAGACNCNSPNCRPAIELGNDPVADAGWLWLSKQVRFILSATHLPATPLLPVIRQSLKSRGL